MKHRSFLGLALAVALTAPSVCAETVVYQNDFSDATKFNAMTCVNADGSTNSYNGIWRHNAYGTKYAYIMIINNTTDGTVPCDDYMATPAIELKAGHQYTLSYNAGGYDYTKALDYSLKSLLSPADATEPTTADDFANYSLLVETTDLAKGYSADNWASSEYTYSKSFVPEVDGSYLIAFYAYAGGIAVDNIKLVDCGNDNTPKAVTDFTVTPGENAATTATITCTLPSEAATGATLAGPLTVSITRTIGEDVQVYTIQNLNPGEPFSWKDEYNPAGSVTYSLQVVNGEETSEPVSATVYVGPDTPRAVTNLTMTRADGVNHIAWTAPTSGLNGSTDLSLSYKVERMVNGRAEAFRMVTEPFYDDEYSSVELATVYYEIYPINYGTVYGASSKTKSIQLGSKSLPLEDSFANKTLDTSIWSLETNTGGSSYKWKADNGSSCKSAKTPYDEDGGFLYYNSYSSPRDNYCRLITPPLNLAAVGNPVISFALYHNTTYSSYKDRIVLEISKDNGEWIEIEGSEIKRYSASASGWTVYEFSLAQFKECESARVAIKAISGGGDDMAIDAVKIYAGIENDLAIHGINGPATIVAGKEGTYTTVITNLGGNTINSSEYSVEFTANGEVFATSSGLDIEPKGLAEFSAPLAVSAAHLGEEFEVTATIVFEADEVEDNNSSASIITSVKAYPGPTATNLKGTAGNDGLLLTWDAPVNEEFETATFVVDGENTGITADAYTADQAVSYPADMNGWANLDIDKQENLANYYPGANPATNARAFQYISADFMGNSNLKDGFGDAYIMVFPPNDLTAAPNDWLISPALPGTGIHTLSLKVKCNGNQNYSDCGKLDILYTTDEEYSTENPAENFTLLETIESKGGFNIPAVWNEYTFEIPATAKHVALNFNTPRGSNNHDQCYNHLKLDDITLTCESLGAPQFNVYSSAPAPEAETFAMLPPASGLTLHNEAPLAESSLNVPTYEKGQTFHVTAVYPGGESVLSEPFVASKPDSGIADAVASEVRVIVMGRTITAAAAGESLDVTVHAANGALIGSSKAVTVAAPGVYIVSAAGTTARVAIR